MILSIETSTDVCSVALSRGAELVAHLEHAEPNAHAANLTPLIERILKENNLMPADLSAVALSSGPGSYTGLRIGASTAKGICYALRIPLVAIGTLDLMAQTIFKECPDCDVAVPMIDARRMEVYTQAVSRQGAKLMQVQPLVLEADSFATVLAQSSKVAFGGNGAAKYQPVVTAHNAFFCDNIQPLAKNMAALAAQKLDRGEVENVAYFEPFYLKEFVATVPKNKVIGTSV